MGNRKILNSIISLFVDQGMLWSFILGGVFMDPIQGATTLERRLVYKAKKSKVPINGSIELLPLCNMNCDMCYIRLSPSEMEAQGRLRSLEEWSQAAEEMKNAGTLFLLLTGGEPLLYPEFKQLYLKLKDMGFVITINTNGTLIDEAWADFFSDHKPRRINITLYGADDQAYRELCHYPGGFDKVIHAVKLLKERDVDIKLSSSLTRANQNDMVRIIGLGEELGIPVRVDTYMMPAVRERNRPYDEQSRLDPVSAARVRIQALKQEMGSELFEKYVRKIVFEVEHILPENGPGKVHCLAGNCSFTINWQGYLRPCVVMSEPSVSVFEEGFEKTWQKVSDAVSEIRTSLVCNACKYRPICRTCCASALLEEGSYDAVPEYMCTYAKESYCLIQEEYSMLLLDINNSF